MNLSDQAKHRERMRRAAQLPTLSHKGKPLTRTELKGGNR